MRSYQQYTGNTTDEWYTPKDLINSFGHFELDPCAPVYPLYQTADVMYNKNDNGLTKDWQGKRVWLNPPYSRPLIELFVKKMAENNNGIALLYNRCNCKMFMDVIFPKASAMIFMRHRVKFLKPDGTQSKNTPSGSVLIAFGEKNAASLLEANIPGKFIRLN